MREQEFPAVRAPEHFEAQERFIAAGAPELTTAFHAALERAARGFDGAGADGFVASARVLVLPARRVVLVAGDGGAGRLGRDFMDAGRFSLFFASSLT